MVKEKKEIGIEKLIRYLLESKGEEYKEEYYEWYRDVELEQNIDSLSELRLFVKWLVDNDKIALEEIGIDYGRIHLVGEKSGRQHIIWQDLARYEALLMLLSISDTPIDDLISYLK